MLTPCKQIITSEALEEEDKIQSQTKIKTLKRSVLAKIEVESIIFAIVWN